MNLTELTVKKIDRDKDILVGTFSLCFEKMLHVDGFRVYYTSAPRHQYSVSFPSNFTVDSPKVRKQIVSNILRQVDQEIARQEIKQYELNDSKIITTQENKK